jgi:hypothetical protein
MIKKRGRAIIEVLVHWKGASTKDDSWELLRDLQEQYPHLAGKVLWRGRPVMGMIMERWCYRSSLVEYQS